MNITQLDALGSCRQFSSLFPHGAQSYVMCLPCTRAYYLLCSKLSIYRRRLDIETLKAGTCAALLVPMNTAINRLSSGFPLSLTILTNRSAIKYLHAAFYAEAGLDSYTLSKSIVSIKWRHGVSTDGDSHLARSIEY